MNKDIYSGDKFTLPEGCSQGLSDSTPLPSDEDVSLVEIFTSAEPSLGSSESSSNYSNEDTSENTSRTSPNSNFSGFIDADFSSMDRTFPALILDHAKHS